MKPPVDENAFEQQQPAAAVVAGNWFPIKGLPSSTTGFEGRPLTFRELKKLSYADEATIEDVMIDVCKSAVRHANNLPILHPDLRYIMLWLRTNTMLDPRFDMQFDCVACAKVSTFKLEPADIETVQLPTSYEGAVGIKAGENVVVVGIPTAQRVLSSKEIERKYSEEEGIGLDAYVSACVLEVDTQPLVTPLDAFNRMNQMSPDAVLRIHEEVGKMDCGVSDVVRKPCKHCGVEQNIELDMTAVFFFPTV